jgi:hypothetical protein
MSLRLGNNIDREGKCLPSKVVANGAKYVRIVGSLDFDQRPLLVFYRTSGRIIIMTLAKESFSKGGNLLPYDTASAELGKMYRDYVDIVQIGNEADHDDPNASSSWTMAPAEWNVLKAMVMRAFGAGVKYIAFGAASGNVDKLKGYDFSGLAGIAVHPYGQRAKPDLNIPFWGGHGDVVPLMYRYFAATGLPIYVTEIGIQVPGDAHTHADARTYLAAMFETLLALPYVAIVVHFCFSDSMVASLGLTTDKGIDKPEQSAMRDATWVDWLIGDGIHERMEKEKDVPRSHEMYTHHPIDGRTLFSVVEGKRNRYRWTPSDGVKVSGSYYN